MQRHIILHIGSPKCGSTFLQNAMLQNSALLAGAGVNYPHAGGPHPGNAADIANVDDAVLESWFQGGAHTVILSHEDLYSLAKRGDPLGDLAQGRGITVQVVAFMRPFNEFVYGDYSQFMKQYFAKFLAARAPYDGRDFYAFAQRRVDTMKPAAYLIQWQRRFTDLPLILASHRDIVPVISALLPPEVAKKTNWAVPPGRVNRSLRTQDCDAIAAAMADPAMSDAQITQMYRDAFKNSGQPDAGRTPERTAWIEEQFADRNARLMEVFSFDNTVK
tara:strand:- start:3397 stop:4221 length:825 start_codon:yes stop_codon:yes gene_type:complete